jgi:Baseplate J-like protein
VAAFVEAEITTSEDELSAQARAKLIELIEAKGVVGYEASEGDLEIIILAVAAGVFSNTTQTAAVVLPAIFRAYGTKLIKLAYNEGAAATATTRWTITPAAGVREIEAGTAIEAAGLGFYVEADTVVPSLASSVELQVVAVERGLLYNGVSGVAQQTNPLDFVTEVQIVGETTGGAEQEEDPAYQDRLAGQLALQAPRPVNAADYAPFVLGVPSSILPTGIVVGRATSIDGYDAETSEENVERCVTTFVTDPEGHALSTPHMETLQAWLRTFREVNFLAFIAAPTYHQVYVTAKIHVLPAYNAEAVVANVKSALEATVNPKVFGNPEGSTTGSNQWINERPGKLRYNVILGIIESTPGVAYVFPGAEGLKIGTSASPTETSDISLSGPAPLPELPGSHIVITSA